MSKFKEGFEHYMEAINNDIKAIDLVITLLEQHKANFEYAEIEKVISFSEVIYLVQNLKKQKLKNFHGILMMKNEWGWKC